MALLRLRCQMHFQANAHARLLHRCGGVAQLHPSDPSALAGCGGECGQCCPRRCHYPAAVSAPRLTNLMWSRPSHAVPASSRSHMLHTFWLFVHLAGEPGQADTSARQFRPTRAHSYCVNALKGSADPPPQLVQTPALPRKPDHPVPVTALGARTTSDNAPPW